MITCIKLKPSTVTTLVIKRKMKGAALSDIFTSALEITERVFAENVNSEPTPSLPAPICLTQTANCYHQHFHPKDSIDLSFVLAEDFLPEGFLHKDISADNNCHLLFATNKMIEILSQARNWFIDANFKIVRHPFTQLLSIHAFIKSCDSLKQVSLLFVVMSGKHKKDCKKFSNL